MDIVTALNPSLVSPDRDVFTLPELHSYSIEYGKGYRFDAKTWESIEKGQQTPHFRAVNAALLSHVAGVDKTTNECFMLGNILYSFLKEKVFGSHAEQQRNSKKQESVSKKDQIRIAHSKEKLDAIGKDISSAVVRSLKIPQQLDRFLHNSIYDVRGLILMLLSKQQSDEIAANELDVAIQKFLEPCNGKSYMESTNIIESSSFMMTDLRKCLEQMRLKFPFDGVKLAVSHPHIIWHTQYDACLLIPPIRARTNQIRTIEALLKFAKDKNPFVILNNAPPGSGKSALLIPIATIAINNETELYVCAGQGSVGMIQFMQALCGAGIIFSSVFIENQELQIVQQHTNRKAMCHVFVGTADAIWQMLKSPSRCGWLVIDEPTYGSDIAGSVATLDIMKLIADLEPINRRVIMFSASLPSADKLPLIMAHFSNRVVEISGNSDSVQMACEVRTHEGDRVLPHTNCKSSAELLKVIASIVSKPFLVRMYNIEIIVMLCNALNAARPQIEPKSDEILDIHKCFQAHANLLPSIKNTFSSAKNLMPDVVKSTLLLILNYISLQTSEIIKAVCAYNLTEIVSEQHAGDINKMIPSDLGTIGVFSYQTMIVDTDPIDFSRTSFDSLLKLIDTTSSEMYKIRDAKISSSEKNAAAVEKRKKKGSSKNNEDEDDDHKKKGSKNSKDDSREDDTKASIVLKFPNFAQIGTLAHQQRFAKPQDPAVKATMNREIKVRHYVTNIPQCNVPDDIQLLLLSGVGILSNRAIKCPIYRSTVWNLASEGKLAYVVTDHTGCYGANLLISTIIVTERFAAVASPATIEQAGGRLCRVGLTYKGLIMLPKSCITGLTDHNDIEAINMETAFSS